MAAHKTVIVELAADTRKLVNGMKVAEKRTSSLMRAARRLGFALAGAFTGRALYRGITRTAKDLDGIIKTAKGVGFAADEYQELIFALDQVGVSAESARIGLGDLQKRLGNKNFAKFFQAAGIDPRELQKMGPAQQLDAALQALTKFRGNQALLVARSGGVFEEQSGKDFAKVINDFERFTQARRDYQRVVGSSVTLKTDAKAVEEFAYRTKLMNAQWEVFKQRVVIQALPALNGLLDDLEKSDAFGTLADDVAVLVGAMADAVRLMSQLRNGAQGSGPPVPGSGTLDLPNFTPQQSAEIAAGMMDERRRNGDGFYLGGASKYNSLLGIPKNAGNVNNYTIEQAFYGVREKDTPRKTRQEMESTLREAR